MAKKRRPRTIAKKRTARLKAADLESIEERPAVDFLVVGIGASAGGLDALNELFRYVQPAGLAFIVVQHLAPDHESILPQLLARSTRMSVAAASDGVAIEANHIYVIPPNVDLAVMHGVIRILPTSPTARVPRLPVDYLFRSLAEDQGRAAIGIVLSGTGTDGTLGLE